MKTDTRPSPPPAEADHPRRFFTAGYGGRTPTEFVRLLQQYGIRTVVDVRLRPNRASMGCYVKAKTKEKGIERLLAGGGIGYRSVPELGNPFLAEDDWKERYRAHLAARADTLLAGLDGVERPFCLLCAEKRVADCHRQAIADELVARGWEVTHIG